jgi:putative Holliday junction resolvase
VAYEDERLTSWEAAERMSTTGHRASRAGGELDSAAARLILQQYLDARRPPADPIPDDPWPEETE